jgi:hypothetical protein
MSNSINGLEKFLRSPGHKEVMSAILPYTILNDEYF